MNLINIKKIFTALSALTLVSCNNDPYVFLNPKMPYEQPFKFDKAGEKTTVDFWVLPKNEKIDGSKHYGVSLSVAYDPKNFDPNNLDDKVNTPFSARLYYVEGQNLTPLEFKGYVQKNKRDGSPHSATSILNDSANIYPDGSSFDGGRYYLKVLWFDPSKYGLYRVILEPKKDNPEMSALDFKLQVSEIRFGK